MIGSFPINLIARVSHKLTDDTPATSTQKTAECSIAKKWKLEDHVVHAFTRASLSPSFSIQSGGAEKPVQSTMRSPATREDGVPGHSKGNRTRAVLLPQA